MHSLPILEPEPKGRHSLASHVSNDPDGKPGTGTLIHPPRQTSIPHPPSSIPERRLPSWLKRPLPRGNGNSFTHELLRELRLETVCENARCPNRPECYARRTATFMILGNVCTRPCGFCSVPRGEPEDLETD